jgi:hypothetical protein
VSRRLTFAAVAAVAVTALAACGGGGGGDATLGGRPPSVAPAFEAPATTTTAPPAVVQPVVPTTAARPGATTAATPSSGATTAPAATPGATPLTPATPGTYRYDTTGTSTLAGVTSPYPAVTTLVVDPPSGTVQHATRDLRDALQAGPVFETTFDYRADGLYVVDLKVTATIALLTQSVDLRPAAPALLLPTGARPGLHRELDLPVAGGGPVAHLVLDVLRTESVTVGGQSVNTSVIHMVATLPGINGGLDFTAWLAPANRIWVKEHFVATAATTDNSVQYQTQYDATLHALG